MFDVWMGEIELTTLTLAVSIGILLPVQLLLCFKVKSCFLRLLPVLLLSVLVGILMVLWLSSTGWDGLGYGLLAVFAGFMLFLCAVGWSIWAIVRSFQKKHSKE